MSGDYTELKALAEAMKGWDLNGCWPDEDDPVNWQVGRLDEEDNRFPVMTIDTADYEQPEAAQVVASYYAAARPLTVLGLIGELEQARQIPPCAPDVFQQGKSVALVGDVSKQAAEMLCRGLSSTTGWRIDWHYIGGRVHVKALPPTALASATRWALSRYNDSGGFSPRLVPVEELPDPGSRTTYILETEALAAVGECEMLRAQLQTEKAQHGQVLQLAARRWSALAKQDARLARLEILARVAQRIHEGFQEYNAQRFEPCKETYISPASGQELDNAVTVRVRLLNDLGAALEGIEAAPVEDDRQAFERAWVAELMREGRDQHTIDLFLERRGNGKYCSERANGAYEGWQLHAARASVKP